MHPLEQIKKYLREKTGICFNLREREECLKRVLGKKIEDFKLTTDEYFSIIRSDSEGLQQLIQKVTVGETYFFRHKPQMELLKKWLRASFEKGKRSFRLWSAGCSSGEEPYSLAMLCAEVLPDCPVEIWGTDINEEALRKGRKGLYTSNSFRRETPSHIQEKYFLPLEKKRWKIRLEIQERVTFHHLNLSTPFYPSEIKGMDIILCRNVLMYLEKEVVSRIMDRFCFLLNTPGLLMVSPSESPLVKSEKFSCFFFGEASGYTKGNNLLQPPKAPPVPLISKDFSSFTRERPKEPLSKKIHKVDDRKNGLFSLEKKTPDNYSPKRKNGLFAEKNNSLKKIPPGGSSEATSQEKKAPSPLHTEKAILLIRQERYMEAIELLLSHPAENLDSQGWYYLALAYENLGLYDDALKAHEKALEKGEDFVLSHLARGELFKLLERPEEIGIEYKKARKILEKMPPTSEVPLSEGILVGALLEILEKWD